MRVYPTIPERVEDRFWAKVQIPSDVSKCWLWVGATMCNYPYTYIDGAQFYAHRLVHVTFNGPIPDGQMALHKCNNKLCVNPTHLYSGDHRQNARDYWRSKGYE